MYMNNAMKKSGVFGTIWKKYGTGTAFFAPFLLFFTVFTIIPVITAIVLSFTDYNMMSAPGFVGFTNYKLLLLEDEEFMIAFKNTILFAAVVGPLTFCLSFIMAWVINQLKCKNMFALAFYAPSITSAVGMSAIWGLIFSNDRYGVINNLLYNLGIIDTPIMFSADKNWIMPVIMLIYVWMGMGTGFLVFLAGLQNVSAELYEAGMIDGVKNRFQELWYITIPQMKPQLLFAAINTVTAAFSVFDISTNFAGMPSANYAGHTLVIHLYDYAFVRFEMGYAAADAVILFCLTYFTGKICMRVFSSKD